MGVQEPSFLQYSWGTCHLQGGGMNKTWGLLQKKVKWTAVQWQLVCAQPPVQLQNSLESTRSHKYPHCCRTWDLGFSVHSTQVPPQSLNTSLSPTWGRSWSPLPRRRRRSPCSPGCPTAWCTRNQGLVQLSRTANSKLVEAPFSSRPSQMLAKGGPRAPGTGKWIRRKTPESCCRRDPWWPMRWKIRLHKKCSRCSTKQKGNQITYLFWLRRRWSLLSHWPGACWGHVRGCRSQCPRQSESSGNSFACWIKRVQCGEQEHTLFNDRPAAEMYIKSKNIILIHETELKKITRWFLYHHNLELGKGFLNHSVK